MSNSPKVNVIIPSYNHANVLPRAIESAAQQSYSNFDIHVIDDASTDNTQQVLANLKYEFTVHCHSENRGGSAARNTGIKNSDGKYVAFLDADDRWEPHKLTKQVKKLEEASSEWRACYCGFQYSRSNRVVDYIDEVIQRPTGFEGGKELIPRIMTKQFDYGGSSTMMVERSLVNELEGFDSTFQRHQDVEFIIRILQNSKLLYVDDQLVTKYGTSRPSLEDAKTSRDLFLDKFRSLINQLEEDGYDVSGVQDFRLAKHHFANSEFKKGTKHFRRGTCPHYRDYLSIGLSVLSGIRGVINSKKKK